MLPWARDRRGAVAVALGLAAPVLAGFAALAIDVAQWEASRLSMQNAADQASLSAGLAAQVGADAVAEARAVAAANGFVHGVSGASVTVARPPTSGALAGNSRALEVRIAMPGRTSFSGPFLPSPPVLSARATSLANGDPSGGMCIMALATTGSALSMSGSGTVDASGCNIYDNSTATTAVNLTGSAKVKGRDIAVSGGIRTTGTASVTATGTLSTNAAATADPYAGRTIPSYPDCPLVTVNLTLTGSQTFTASGSTPYVFCGDVSISGSGTVTFNPGIYVFKKGVLNLSGSMTVNATGGVTLIFTPGFLSGLVGLNISGSQTVNVRAPSSGPTQGIAIWIEKKTNAILLSMTISGSQVWNVTGAVYAPSVALSWSGSGTSTCTQLVASTISFTGSTNLQHQCTGVGVADPPNSLVAAATRLSE